MENDDHVAQALESNGFEAIFAIYGDGREAIATEHLSVVLEKMGYTVPSHKLEAYLDELDPEANGEITKAFTTFIISVFLKWFSTHADSLEDEDENEPTTRENEREPLTAIHSEMLDAKVQRKRTEDDVQLLANRLAHLRMEEKKAQKKIDEAIKRAQDIAAIKKRNADHLRWKREHIERQQSNVPKLSGNSQKRKESAFMSLAEQRTKQAQDKKSQMQQLSCQLSKEREMEKFRLMKQSEAIKKCEQEAARKRELARKKQEKQLIKQARDKLAEEYKKKSMAENVLREMEDEEARLIEKLRNTQEHQKEAFMHLEHAIQMQIND
ncbi:hypothetical protein THRCLA_04933 [Thraustotheca clavata]|uniref:Uncharacterized protein n=1 Tax=Thraustotheca clavata TaxID=74557 RepID=A0A1V9ZXN2_9STRA|nr:hypothetical protein THRCLA_04933 [Thraustotheca clavata]